MNHQLINIDSLITIVSALPKENYYYEGIKENSLNLLIAPPKVGKTTFAENLAMCIAAGHSSFLGKPIWYGSNQRVMIISLEEFYRARTERNKVQLSYLDKIIGNSLWHQNLFVSSPDAPRYIETLEQWDWLINEIQRVNPAFTVIDSLSRLHGSEAIEDSSTSIKLMKRLRDLVVQTGTTILVVHHTNKIGNDPLTLFNMAGSRIIGQEADAILGMNKTPLGKRYIKPLAYRYADDSADMVQLFIRNEHHWLENAGSIDELKILREFDNRVNSSNEDEVYNFMREYTGGDTSVIVNRADLVTRIVDIGIMSTPTLHSSLNKLVLDKKIERPDKGQYKLV